MSIYVQVASHALYMILLLSLPPLLASLIVGLVISLLQALTQVQEQTLTFVPKMIATILTLMICASFILTQLVNSATKIFNLIPNVGRGM
jgi:flagellar biosynthetic protein FliQ